MNTEKSFVTCYDKGCEEYAETLMTLVSKDKALKNIKREREEFKKDRGIVSGEYVLTIGKKGSKYNSRNFKDIYNNYGIHFGYYGTKAWMYCEKFKWNLSDTANFTVELHSTLERLGMSTEKYEKYVKANLQYKQLWDDYLALRNDTNEYIETTGIKIENYDELKHYNPELVNQLRNNTNETISLIKESSYELSWISDLSGSNQFKLQYHFAVALFYDKYIHDFMGIKREGSEEINKKEEKQEENF